MSDLPFLVADDGTFNVRPSLDDVYLSPQRQALTIASIWDSGVVFHGGPSVTAQQLQRYTFIKKGEVDETQNLDT